MIHIAVAVPLLMHQLPLRICITSLLKIALLESDLNLATAYFSVNFDGGITKNLVDRKSWDYDVFCK